MNVSLPPTPRLSEARIAAMRRALVLELDKDTPRRRTHRRLIVLAAAVAVLVAAGTAVGISTDFLAEQARVDRQPWQPPEYLPTVDRIEIARGPDWSVMAWKSAGGLCFAIAAGDAEPRWARGCGRIPDRASAGKHASDYLITVLWFAQPAADGLRAMVGAVTREVAVVDVLLSDRTVAVRTTPAPAVVSRSARIFLLRDTFAEGLHRQPYRGFVMRDARGNVLERYMIGD